MKKTIFSIIIIFITNIIYSQIQPVDVADLTFKVGGLKTKELYYGFSEGDQIVFNFKDLKGKSIKEIEIIELPDNSKFMDYKTKIVSNKIIKVNKTAVYKFIFKNSAISGRICKINVQRIPKTEELTSFNTDWEWKTIYDTTYVPYTQDSIVGYDTTYVPYTKKELIRIDTTYKELHNPNTVIHMYSKGNVKACFGKSASCTKNKIALVYPSNTKEILLWVGVGQESRDAYNKLSKSILKMGVKAGAAYSSMGTSLLVSSITNKVVAQQIDNLPTSSNVLDIFLTDYTTANYWYNDYNSNIDNTSSYTGLKYKNRAKLKVHLYKSQIPSNKMILCLKNNSYSVGTSVTISAVAMLTNKIYENKTYKKQKIKARKVTLNKQRMKIKTTKIRINAK